MLRGVTVCLAEHRDAILNRRCRCSCRYNQKTRSAFTDISISYVHPIRPTTHHPTTKQSHSNVPLTKTETVIIITSIYVMYTDLIPKCSFSPMNKWNDLTLIAHSLSTSWAVIKIIDVTTYNYLVRSFLINDRTPNLCVCYRQPNLSFKSHTHCYVAVPGDTSRYWDVIKFGLVLCGKLVTIYLKLVRRARHKHCGDWTTDRWIRDADSEGDIQRRQRRRQ